MSTTPTIETEYLSVAEAAERAGVNPLTIREAIKAPASRRLRASQPGGKNGRLRIKAADLQAWLDTPPAAVAVMDDESDWDDWDADAVAAEENPWFDRRVRALREHPEREAIWDLEVPLGPNEWFRDPGYFTRDAIAGRDVLVSKLCRPYVEEYARLIAEGATHAEAREKSGYNAALIDQPADAWV